MTDIQRAMLGDHEAAKRLTEQFELLPCVCGGKLSETGALCNYAKKTLTLNLKCKKCGTTVRFKAAWSENPIHDAFLAWNTRAPLLTPEQIEMLERMVEIRG